MQKHRPAMLVIMDSWGWHEDLADNAVLQARTPTFGGARPDLAEARVPAVAHALYPGGLVFDRVGLWIEPAEIYPAVIGRRGGDLDHVLGHELAVLIAMRRRPGPSNGRDRNGHQLPDVPFSSEMAFVQVSDRPSTSLTGLSPKVWN
jgi:hypothetical protein